MNRVISLILVISLIFCQSIFVECWSEHGHLISTQIMLNNINEHTEEMLTNDLNVLFEELPNYSNILSSSLWADVVRYSGNETIYGLDSYAPSELGKWHYIDKLFHYPNTINNENSNSENSDDGKDEEINVLWAIDRIINRLEQLKLCNCSNLEKVERSVLIRMLIHIVQDLHQPLHNIELVNKDYPNGDRGGNEFMIWYGWKYMRLHYFWDRGGYLFKGNVDLPLSDMKINEISAIANEFMSTIIHDINVNDIINLDFEEWHNESHLLGQENYIKVMRSRNINKNYVNFVQSRAMHQIGISGLRLAHILTFIYNK
jgi:hypothetical protein